MMDKSITFSRSGKPSSGRRVRLIPSTPRPEISTPAYSSSSTTDTTQSLETSRGESQPGSFREVMRRVRPTGEMPYPFIFQTTNAANEETTPSAPNSLESLDEIGSLSDTQTAISTSSSSHNLLVETDSKEEEIESDGAEGEDVRKGRSVGRNKVPTGSEQVGSLVNIIVIDSEEDEMEMKGGSSQAGRLGMGITSSLLEESVSKAIREMQEIEGRRKRKSIETQDEAETREGEADVPVGWKNRIEETVNRLVAENATQRTMLKEQGEQMVKVVDLMRRMISVMEEKPDSARQRPTPIPTSRDVGPSTTPVQTAAKRKTTTGQPPSELPTPATAKKTRHSGSFGSQRKN